jgi:6,7-dimethyl-8-ribityllumazine synthase
MSFRFTIVASEFNREYTDALVRFAEAGLEGHRVLVRRVPGSFEIPLEVQTALLKDKPDAVLAMGLIWQGKTRHASLIAETATEALMRLMLEFRTPVVHQILTVHTEAEARARCMGKTLNRGKEAAAVALRLAEQRSRHGKKA